MPSEQAENQLTLEPVQLYQFEDRLRSFLDVEYGWFNGIGRSYKKDEIERLIFNFKSILILIFLYLIVT